MADAALYLPIAGGIAGIAMGAIARHQRFCTLAALERHWYAGDSSGVRTWGLAAAVAIALTQALMLSGGVDLSGSFYLSPNFGWTGAVLGGLLFGFGMALVGTCGFGALVRLGGGSLRSFIILIVLGLSALGAQRGLFALARIEIVDNLAADLGFAGDQSLGSLISSFVGFEVHAVVAAMVVLGLSAWVFSDRSFRTRYANIFTGILIGSVIAFGWFATSWAESRYSSKPDPSSCPLATPFSNS